MVNNNNNNNNKRKQIGASSPTTPTIKAQQQNKDDTQDGHHHNHHYMFLPEHSTFNKTKNNITQKDAESLIAQQMNSLTVNERQLAYEDLHGVSEIVKETPEFVAESIEQLQRELDKIKNKDAYEKALIQGPKYVDTKRFKLLFLRSTYFDTRKAAFKLVRHFKEKLHWFGENVLGRPIIMADMGDEEMKIIKSGFLQILPCRDRIGRRIFWITPLGDMKTSVESLARAYWYMTLVLYEVDDETQIRGHVVVIYNNKHLELNPTSKKFAYVLSRVVPAFPSRVVGAHYCLSDPKMAALVAFFSFATEKRINCRCRVHQGSDTELQYKLMTFGINHKTLPITSSGTAKIKGHKEWIQRQVNREQKFPYLLYDGPQQTKEVEQSTCVSDSNDSRRLAIIDWPGHYDIMLGRGVPCQTHSGNVQLVDIVESFQEELDNAPRGGRKVIYEQILKKIHLLGGRFLEQQKEGWWIEVSNDVAMKKIFFTCSNRSPKRREQQR